MFYTSSQAGPVRVCVICVTGYSVIGHKSGLSLPLSVVFNDRSESNNILLRRYLVDFSSNRLMCKTLFISCFYCQILILSTKNNFIHAYTTKFITFKRYFRYLTSYLHVFNGHIYHEKLFLRWSNRKYYTLKLAIARKGARSVSFWWDQLLRECPSSGIYCDEGIELSLPSHP